MTESLGETQDGARGALFSATLTPHRSLGPRGFVVLMSVLGGVSFVAGIVFAWLGAWPILGFFGLDVLIVYVAFKLNYRSGRLYETLDLDRDALRLTRVHPSGRRERFDFSAYWVRVILDTASDGRSAMRLSSHGRTVTFGAFLTDDERLSLADALKKALLNARRAV